jgi:peptidoglycan/xylan/chitin deacetylase (PgdA/CDA1 family)
MDLGPILDRAAWPCRRPRLLATALAVALLVAGVATVAVWPRATPRPRSRPRRAALVAPVRPVIAAGRSSPVMTCPPPAPPQHTASALVGGDSAGRGVLPAAVRRSPWVRYRLPATPGARTVALTFDDGPTPRYTPRILAILARTHTPATFFMIGGQAAAHPALVRRVAAAGEEVGGHTWHHARLDRLSSAAVVAEVDCTDRLLARLAGHPVRAVRPPDGAYTKTVVELLAARGVVATLWTVDSRDWARPGVARILATVARELRPGAIVLFHDGGGDRSQTVAALPGVLALLAGRGYRVVALPGATVLKTGAVPAAHRTSAAPVLALHCVVHRC